MATESFFNINTFREKLNGGSKANLFRMSIGLNNAPIEGVVLTNFSTLCNQQ